jgi:hypothetical protein
MSMATTVLHIQGQGPDAVERALAMIFGGEGRVQTLRLQGTYSALLARVLDPGLDAGYRYLILRPHAGATWTPLLEVGNRADGLHRALSETLDGAAVCATFVYGDGVSGYRMVRGGVEVDRYLSDPTYFGGVEADERDVVDVADDAEASGAVRLPADVAPVDVEAVRGHPERFADLLPDGTRPEDFARVVLQPGWWEEQAAEAIRLTAAVADDGDGEEEVVDEVDRMRCIGLALELWGPSEYPFAQELEDIANKDAGPAIALAFT